MIPIREYKPRNKPEHPEIAEFRKKPKDSTITDELMQSEMAVWIIEYAEATRDRVADVENGVLDMFNPDDILTAHSKLVSFGNTTDEFYSQLNKDYQASVKDVYKQFLIDNSILISKLERKLKGE